MLGLTVSSKLDWVLTLPILLKLPPRKLEPWFVLRSFFLLRLLFISMNLPSGHVLNTVVMSGLVLLVVTWNCWISYKNGYAGLLVLHCCILWTLVHRRNVASLSLFCRYYLVDVHRISINWFSVLTLEGVLLLALIDCMIFLSPFLNVTRISMSTVSFLARLESGILGL